MNSPETRLDHIVIACPNHEAGKKFLSSVLGVTLVPGGKHEKMSTHNYLVGLGKSTYLELISKDPEAPRPDRVRWFGLDTMDEGAGPHMTWVIRSNDINASLTNASEWPGPVLPMSRGEYHWNITVPDDGNLVLGGAIPSMIQWQTAILPAEKLPDSGCSLDHLEIAHPEPHRISAFLESVNFRGPVKVIQSSDGKVKLTSVIETGHGVVRLDLT